MERAPRVLLLIALQQNLGVRPHQTASRHSELRFAPEDSCWSTELPQN